MLNLQHILDNILEENHFHESYLQSAEKDLEEN